MALQTVGKIDPTTLCFVRYDQSYQLISLIRLMFFHSIASELYVLETIFAATQKSQKSLESVSIASFYYSLSICTSTICNIAIFGNFDPKILATVK